MDNDGSSKETHLMEANNNIKETSSSMSHNNVTDEEKRIYILSGDELTLQEMNIVLMMWMTCQNSKGRLQMFQHNIGLWRDQYIREVLKGHPWNCIDMFRMEVTAFHYVYDILW
ncbi:hypothetical protein I3843_03G157200 [Carya illinoinensis]|uniref:Uncharacterized protein n=1 Tax=Carya illinoinensis TaxID=32201 RepID=A0A922JYV3_CARIL|nr:hypothetical protein I3842_03G154800 [Carya illinoinensis]KAG7987904.1 hypothetical protein I3843_03G157200 [Carya illinoinensis]